MFYFDELKEVKKNSQNGNTFHNMPKNSLTKFIILVSYLSPKKFKQVANKGDLV